MIIDQLPLLNAAQATDEIPIERGITTYKVTAANLVAVGGGTSAPLKDASSAVVGTSASLSHEDHQHPLNVATSGTPEMDGVASLGSASSYARTDHVHPSDTSRQETLVSGTNIKTINNTSILGSGDIALGVDSVNGKTGTVVLDLDDIGLADLLWTNASPTSSFATQTVQIDLTNYDAVIIFSHSSNTGTVIAQNTIAIKGYTESFVMKHVAFSGTNVIVYTRNSYISEEGVQFSDATSQAQGGSSTTANTTLIPYKIYGIKGVQT